MSRSTARSEPTSTPPARNPRCSARRVPRERKTCLGTAQPTPLSKLRRVGRPDVPLAEALHETSFRGLQLLHLGMDEPGGTGSRGDKLTKLMAGLRDLDAEYVVVDLGVGLAREL